MAIFGSDGRHHSRPRFFKVLLPSCFDKLKIPGKLARLLADKDECAESRLTVILVSPLGKLWHAELCRDGPEVFLGSGWPEFARAHGIAIGWFIVFRYEGQRVLSIKLFDTSCCRRDFHKIARNAVTADVTSNSNVATYKPQFIKILQPDCSQKLRIPPKFAQDHITQKSSSQMATIFSPLGKFWHIELNRDRSDVFLGSGWARFLTAHDLSEGDVLLFRYEGNTVFTIKVFGPSGCQKVQNAQVQNAEAAGSARRELGPSAEGHAVTTTAAARLPKNLCAVPSFSGKRKNENVVHHPGEYVKKPKCEKIFCSTAAEPCIERTIQRYAVDRNRSYLSFPLSFHSSIGLRRNCTIRLTTSVQRARLWPVSFRIVKHYSYIAASSWYEFRKDNGIKAGDRCIFRVVEKDLWHVQITSSTTID